LPRDEGELEITIPPSNPSPPITKEQINNEEESPGQPPLKKQKLKIEKVDKKNRFKDPKGCGATNLQTYRYPDFCGVLGKKIKRMQCILNERNN
jgi:hypothetical protein